MEKENALKWQYNSSKAQNLNVALCVNHLDAAAQITLMLW